jgi:hypothetical protein
MTSITLYEIAKEFRQITDVLQDAGCDEQTLLDTLEGERWPLEVKGQQYAFVIRNLEASAEAIKAAEKQMADRRKSIENRARYLTERLKLGMEIAGVSKLECPHFAIAIQNNPPSVDVFEPALIPADLMTQPETPPAVPNKAAIKEAIKAGREVPGALMVQGKRLAIK